MKNQTRRLFIGLALVVGGATLAAGLRGCGSTANAPEPKLAAPPVAQNVPSYPLIGLYTDPAYFAKVPWGSYSHWLQPWRAYLETVPATTFLNGLGINFNGPTDSNCPDLIAQMLNRNGICRARIEIGWNNISYDDETQLTPDSAQRMAKVLIACKNHGLRPLILLNSNEGWPCPSRTFGSTLAQDAKVGDRTIFLENTEQVHARYTGLLRQEYPAAFPFITSIDAASGKCELSAPLRKPLTKGPIELATLKYRPFSPPDTADYQETIAGWQRYAGNVAQFVAQTLGTTGQSDLGFDMEIWNEMTFGDQFLRVNQYYDPPLYPNLHEPEFLWSLVPNGITPKTIQYVNAHPALFAGVQIGDGFSNTLPWQASSAEPARVGAIDKHPYSGRKAFPAEKVGGRAVDALGQIDESGFIPSYTELFPEYYATALQTETMIRDIRPSLPEAKSDATQPEVTKSDSFDAAHGRESRVVDGRVVHCPVWITEVNIAPIEDDPKVNLERALALKAKSAARYYCFFLNKGVTQLDLFAVMDGDDSDKQLGTVRQNFLAYARGHDAVYPKDDAQYLSPALAVTGRIAARMRENLDPTLTPASTRSLQVGAISDTHNHCQFVGDGTAAHPNLYNRDVLAILPFQVNQKRFVIPYYVMTRDYTKDMPPERYTVRLDGVHGKTAQITTYDPISDLAVPVAVEARSDNSITLELTAADYPYLLTIQE